MPNPDPKATLTLTLTRHLMSFHRSMLFAAVGAEVMRTAVALLDMWLLSADQSTQCEGVHYDELYVHNRSTYGDGLVSQATKLCE